MKYTLKELLEVQKKVDAGISREDGNKYTPWLAAVGEVIEKCEHLKIICTWRKQSAPEFKQAFMECPDILAFLLSECIKSGNIIDDNVLSHNYEKPIYKSIDSALRVLVSSLAINAFEDAILSLEFLVNAFFDRPIQDVFYYYMGKKELTKFRQSNGYQEGTYIKNWAGMEDNEHLTGMLEKGVSIDNLPKALDQSYKAAVNHA